MSHRRSAVIARVPRRVQRTGTRARDFRAAEKEHSRRRLRGARAHLGNAPRRLIAFRDPIASLSTVRSTIDFLRQRVSADVEDRKHARRGAAAPISLSDLII